MRAMFIPDLIISFSMSTEREAGPAERAQRVERFAGGRPDWTPLDWRGRRRCGPTDGADDAGVACGGGFRVDVQQAHVFQESVGHGSVELLMLNEGRAQV